MTNSPYDAADLERVEWLRAQFDEDERTAGRAGADDPSWAYDRDTFTVSSRGGWSIAARKDDGSPINDVDGEHIAEHDPARVLREVEGKRQVLALAETHLRFDAKDPNPFYVGFGYALLRALALPYAERPGFREEWARA